MKVLIGILVLAIVNTPLVSAATYSRPYTPSYNYSYPKTYSQPSRPSTTPSRPSTTPKTTTPQSSRVGTAPLRSRTTPPKPHDYNGLRFNSSAAKYTNTSGLWVFWWLMYVNADGSKELRCYDEKHNRITCNRDDKAYQKDW